MYIIVEVFVLSCVSHALSQRLNFTQLLERSLRPGSYETRIFRDASSTNHARDIAYLPEENYNNEDPRKDENELEQFERRHRNLMPEYRNLCEIKTKKVQLSDTDFEYQPPHYVEVFCKDYSLIEQAQTSYEPSKQKCVHPGFHCVQRSRTVFMLRRRWNSDCWEPFTKEIASRCDCMWPVSILGDITAHY